MSLSNKSSLKLGLLYIVPQRFGRIDAWSIICILIPQKRRSGNFGAWLRIFLEPFIIAIYCNLILYVQRLLYTNYVTTYCIRTVLYCWIVCILCIVWYLALYSLRENITDNVSGGSTLPALAHSLSVRHTELSISWIFFIYLNYYIKNNNNLEYINRIYNWNLLFRLKANSRIYVKQMANGSLFPISETICHYHLIATRENKLRSLFSNSDEIVGSFPVFGIFTVASSKKQLLTVKSGSPSCWAVKTTLVSKTKIFTDLPGKWGSGTNVELLCKLPSIAPKEWSSDLKSSFRTRFLFFFGVWLLFSAFGWKNTWLRVINQERAPRRWALTLDLEGETRRLR